MPAVAGKASLAYKKQLLDAKDTLQWKWLKGAATAKSDFGDPLGATSYQLCIYDGNATVLFDDEIPAGGVCGVAKPRPCWEDKPTGFTYKNKDLDPDGIEQLQLKAGSQGKASIKLKGVGAPLGDPALPFTEPIIVQLLNSDGACWEAVYSAPATKNTAGPPGQFKDKAD